MLALATAAQSWADDLGSGKKLYTTKCARCHKFYDPNAYDDAKWNDWMGKMRMKAHLTDEQYAQLSSYLRSVRVEAKTK
jgi:mono/diheme cytochrome c family protein